MPRTRARRTDRSLKTGPWYSSGSSTATSATGSSSRIAVREAASRSASAPADWKAASEESTEWALPSTSVTRTSTSGWPSPTPFSSWARTPFSTEGMKFFGTAPPTTWSTNSNPVPPGSGSTRSSQIAYCPCPPDCLTRRPCPVAVPPKVSRSATLYGTCATCTPCCSASWCSTTPTCASPVHQRTS